MTTFLVTGGAGFIGSALVRHLVRVRGVTVVTVDKLTYAGHVESLAEVMDDPRHRLVRVDVADAEAIRQVLAAAAPDAVLHLAAESHVDRSVDSPADFLHTNVTGTFTLLQEAVRYWRGLGGDARARFRFLHVSTDEVFGSLGPTGRFSETTPYDPRSPYSASKAAGDHFARAWHHTYGLPTIVTNCSNNYGPYQYPEKLVPLMVQKAVAGEPLPVYGQGENVRDWLFVEDHVAALLAALQRGVPGETYAFGGNAERRNIDVVRTICAIVDELVPDARIGPREALIRHVTDRPGHDRRYAIDATKAERELGWTPTETFESGLRKTVEWYLANQAWSRAVQAGGSYAGERLGLGGAAGGTRATHVSR